MAEEQWDWNKEFLARVEEAEMNTNDVLRYGAQLLHELAMCRGLLYSVLQGDCSHEEIRETLKETTGKP